MQDTRCPTQPSESNLYRLNFLNRDIASKASNTSEYLCITSKPKYHQCISGTSCLSPPLFTPVLPPLSQSLHRPALPAQAQHQPSLPRPQAKESPHAPVPLPRGINNSMQPPSQPGLSAESQGTHKSLAATSKRPTKRTTLHSSNALQPAARPWAVRVVRSIRSIRGAYFTIGW